jgi:biopolymer transport protein ExbD
MRRFSQRNPLVTLNDINITPLLDLAFVLLIIFIITTPLLEQSVRLDLPQGGAENAKATKDDIRTIEITPDGFYKIKGRNLNIKELEARLVEDFKANPKLAIYIRADKKEAFEKIVAVLNVCEKHGIKRLDFGTKPDRK